jgi:hypothetical protein
MIRNGVEAGYINPLNESLITFVDGPSDHTEHESFDWGRAALDTINSWTPVRREYYYDWSKQRQTTNGHAATIADP